jgi:hypothetical protein
MHCWHCHMLGNLSERAAIRCQCAAQARSRRGLRENRFSGSVSSSDACTDSGTRSSFLRYGPALRASATRVIFEAPLGLVALLRCQPYIDEVISWVMEVRMDSPRGINKIEVMEFPYANQRERPLGLHGRPIASKCNMRVCALAVLITARTVAEAQRSCSGVGSPEQHHSETEFTWQILKPFELPAPEVSQLRVPSGFRIQKFAKNAGSTRILAIGPHGNVCVTRREEGDILMFWVGTDGLATGEPDRVASPSGEVYLAAVHEIYKADVLPMELLVHWT